MNEAGVNETGGGVSGTGGAGGLHAVAVTVNEKRYERRVEPRLLLSDFLRHDLGLTGTHVGCEHGVCGACTVLVDGEAVRSCLLLAVQADGHEVTTVEALAPGPETLHPLQEAFRECHALQCGFCTPGFLMTLVPFLRENLRPSDDEIRHAISGNLCRCTGYQNIVAAVRLAAAVARGEGGEAGGSGDGGDGDGD
jgi:carbon-monoxide dehydrogenase small subunit